MLRPTWFEIDLDAAVDNVRTVRRLVGPERKIFAVVKADAYGFGSLEMGRAFAENGADALGVADLADGVRLRRAGLALPILVYPNALPASPRAEGCRSRIRRVAVRALHRRPRRAQGVDVPIRLAASSPLVLGFPSTYLNAVDPGRMLYGYGGEEATESVVLRPAFSALKSRLVEVKDVAPRERFAAAAPFPIVGAMRLGVIPVGMGDGFHRLNAGGVLVRGRRVPILARPSLEHTRLDLTTVPDAAVGDEVVLIGRQGAEAITLDEIAERDALDSLALALGVGPRVARVYVTGNRAARRAPAESAG